MTGFTFYVIGRVGNATPVVICGFNTYPEAEDLLEMLEYNATYGSTFYITTHPPEEQNGSQ